MTLRKLQNLSKAFLRWPHLSFIYISLSLFVSGLAKFNFVISAVFAIFVALLQNFVIFVTFETEFNLGHISLCGELLRPLARLKFDQFQTLRNNSQQHTTQLACNNVCIRTQHATCNNIASVCTGLEVNSRSFNYNSSLLFKWRPTQLELNS